VHEREVRDIAEVLHRHADAYTGIDRIGGQPFQVDAVPFLDLVHVADRIRKYRPHVAVPQLDRVAGNRCLRRDLGLIGQRRNTGAAAALTAEFPSVVGTADG